MSSDAESVAYTTQIAGPLASLLANHTDMLQITIQNRHCCRKCCIYHTDLPDTLLPSPFRFGLQFDRATAFKLWSKL